MWCRRFLQCLLKEQYTVCIYINLIRSVIQYFFHHNDYFLTVLGSIYNFIPLQKQKKIYNTSEYHINIKTLQRWNLLFGMCFRFTLNCIKRQRLLETLCVITIRFNIPCYIVETRDQIVELTTDFYSSANHILIKIVLVLHPSEQGPYIYCVYGIRISFTRRVLKTRFLNWSVVRTQGRLKYEILLNARKH